jgi:hypothetical protein
MNIDRAMTLNIHVFFLVIAFFKFRHIGYVQDYSFFAADSCWFHKPPKCQLTPPI